MADLGQPLHAFDATTLKNRSITIGPIAQENVELHLLDQSVVTLPVDALVIKNGSQPIALAGIMGTEATKITANTHDILIEAAHFTSSYY